jgi:hypothetical protein
LNRSRWRATSTWTIRSTLKISALLCEAVNGQAIPGNGDLDGNQQIDFDDVVYLVTTLLGTTFGDANLDGIFNSTDLVQVFRAGEYEDSLQQNSTWETGDWDCDGEFGTSDLILAFQFGGYSLASTPTGALSASGLSSLGSAAIGSALQLPARHLDQRRLDDEADMNRRRRGSETDHVFANYDEAFLA